jgi:hypothetical protein
MSLVVTKVCQGVDLVPLWTFTFAIVRDQVLSSWLVIFRHVTRSYHPWSTSAITPTNWDQKILCSTLPRLNIDNSTSGLLHHQLLQESLLKSISAKWRCLHLWPTQAYRMDRTNSIALIELPLRIRYPWVVEIPRVDFMIASDVLNLLLECLWLLVVYMLVLAFRPENPSFCVTTLPKKSSLRCFPRIRAIFG